MKTMIQNLLKKNQAKSSLGLIVLIIILWVVLGVSNPFFFTEGNIRVLLLQASIIAICGVGITFVLISGGTDLSCGAVCALASMMTGISLTKWGWGAIPSILVALAVGVVFGLINGTLVARFKLQPMICTLGTTSIARGLALISTTGYPIMVFNPTMNYLGNGRVFGLTIPIIIAIVVCVIGFVILNYSEFGRYVYSIGGNEEATRLSGINVTFYKTMVYVMTGVCSALVGVLYVATLGASEPTVGNGLELDAIAVTAIGGTSLAGGRGGLIGTILGAILIGTIKNGLTLLNIVSYYQQVIIGVVIIVAVLLEYFRKNN